MNARSDGGDWPRTTRLLPWSLAGFLAMIWLLPFDSITLPIPLPLDGKLDRPALVGLVMLWVLAFTVLRGTARPRIRLTPIHVAAMLFFIAATVGALLNVDALVNLDELHLVLKKLVLLASYLGLLFVVASSVRPKEVPRFVLLMLGLAAVASIGTIVEYRFQFNPFYQWSMNLPALSVSLPPDLYGRDSIGRLSVYGPGGHPLETATLLGVALPFALVNVFDDGPRRSRIIYAAVAALLLTGAMATGRKTSVVAPALGVLLLFAYRPKPMLRLALPLLVAFGAVVHTLAPQVIGSLFYQLQPAQLFGTLSTQDRASDFDGVSPDVTSHLFFGRGYESYDPHKYRILDNEYLSLIVGVGFVGLAMYLLIITTALFAAHQVIRNGSPPAARFGLASAAAVVVVASATGLFDLLSFPHIPYMFFFICGLLVVWRKHVGELHEPPSPQARHAPAALLPARVHPAAAGPAAA